MMRITSGVLRRLIGCAVVLVGTAAYAERTHTGQVPGGGTSLDQLGEWKSGPSALPGPPQWPGRQEFPVEGWVQPPSARGPYSTPQEGRNRPEADDHRQRTWGNLPQRQAPSDGGGSAPPAYQGRPWSEKTPNKGPSGRYDPGPDTKEPQWRSPGAESSYPGIYWGSPQEWGNPYQK